MPSRAAAQAAADYSVTDTDGNPSYKGDLTLLALFLDKAQRAVPQAPHGAQHVSLIEKGYILDRRNNVVVYSAEHALDISTHPDRVYTFDAPAPTPARTATKLTDEQKERYSLSPEALDQAHREAVDLYFSWMDKGTADELRPTAAGSINRNF